MNCRQCSGIEAWFDKKVVARELSRYRKKGPRKTTRMLIDAAKSEGVEGMTLLDIGGGVGAIQHELLKAGAGSVVSVDASTAYVEAAEDEAKRQGHADRVHYLYGDFVNLASDIPEVDIVTLDRVICCYDNMEALVRLSSMRARKFYGLVYPRDAWWIKLANPVGNFCLWVSRNPFRIFVHPTEAVDAVVRSNGLERCFYRKTVIWQVVVYSRRN